MDVQMKLRRSPSKRIESDKPLKCVFGFCSEEVDMIFELELEHMIFVNVVLLFWCVDSVAQ
jgi:hypothetical protein